MLVTIEPELGDGECGVVCKQGCRNVRRMVALLGWGCGADAVGRGRKGGQERGRAGVVGTGRKNLHVFHHSIDAENLIS